MNTKHIEEYLKEIAANTGRIASALERIAPAAPTGLQEFHSSKAANDSSAVKTPQFSEADIKAARAIFPDMPDPNTASIQENVAFLKSIGLMPSLGQLIKGAKDPDAFAASMSDAAAAAAAEAITGQTTGEDGETDG